MLAFMLLIIRYVNDFILSDFTLSDFILLQTMSWYIIPREFIISKLLIRKLGSSSVLMKIRVYIRIENFAIINLRGVFTILYFKISTITLQTFTDVIIIKT